MPNFLDKIIDFMKPKAHDAIDAITERWEESQSSPLAQLPPEHEELIQNLVMGTMGGGGAGKGLRQLVLALKGKIKGGKMIPSQPIRKGTIGGPNPSKLDILLNKLKDNPNIGGNINRVMLENVKKYKPKK